MPRFITAAEEAHLLHLSERFSRAGLRDWTLVGSILAEVQVLRLAIRQLIAGRPREELAELPDGVLGRLLLLPPAPEPAALSRWPSIPCLDQDGVRPNAPEGPSPHEHTCPACRRTWACNIDRSFCPTDELHCDDCWPAERRRRLLAQDARRPR